MNNISHLATWYSMCMMESIDLVTYLVSFIGTPYLKLTVPYGIPVLVSNAGNNRFAYQNKSREKKKTKFQCKFTRWLLLNDEWMWRTTSSANLKSGPLHGHPGSNAIPDLCCIKCAPNRPPTTRIFVSAKRNEMEWIWFFVFSSKNEDKKKENQWLLTKHRYINITIKIRFFN